MNRPTTAPAWVGSNAEIVRLNAAGGQSERMES
jgi:hypothetical protein